MASGERVLKLSSEAFSRLKNDHEQFLEGYEKPTQIYRFLHARHSLKPLFMHRNLSYMQHRNQRRKKRHRIRISNLLKYRRQRRLEGADLATQIKSDNFLKITFHQLEKGIDFNHLLSAALTGDVESVPPTTCHAPSLMEVEVLLYNCHQHTTEATFCHDNSISLGKFEIEYAPSKNEKVSTCRAGTLSIPESKLVWSGGKNRGSGSLMLVFRATASTGGGKQRKKEKPSLNQSLAQVSVELNRINHSDIVQLTKTKQTMIQTPLSPTNDSKLTRDLQNAVERDSRLSDSIDSEPMDTRGNSGNTCSRNSIPGVMVETCTNNLRKITRSKAKDRRDACIMTDLSLGTGHATMTTPPSTTACQHSRCNGPSHLSEENSCDQPCYPKKGFTETSTSLLKKLSSQHNGLNGINLLNGYPNDHQSKELTPNHHQCDNEYTSLDSKDYSLTVSIPCATYHNGSPVSCCTESNHNHHHDHHDHSKRKVPARKRSEIQLLLDGDKPPGQRISPEEIPIITAEELSNRTSSRGTTYQSNCSWTQLGTGTRKITPVEPFTYSVISPTLTPRKTMGGGQTKRSLSDSDMDNSLDISSPPPLKIARIDKLENDDMCMDYSDRDCDMFDNHERTDAKLKDVKSMSSSPVPSPPLNVEENDTTHETHRNTVEPHSVTGIAPEGLFCSEVVVFDSRGECLLDEGEYTLLMQKGPQKDGGDLGEAPPLVTFSPLSWNTVFGGAEQDKVDEAETMMLKFSLSWSRGPPKHRLISELETALDLQRLRNDYFSSTSPSPSTTPISLDSPTTTTVTSPAPLPAPAPSITGHSNHDDTPPNSESPPLPSSVLPSNTTATYDSSNASSSCSSTVVQEEREEGTGMETGETREAILLDGRETVPEMMEGRQTVPVLQKERCIPQHDTIQHQDISKDDPDEYFTATETSTSSSVADSTEMTQCHGTPRIPTTCSGISTTTSLPLQEGDKVVYNFLYHNNSLQQTESRGDMRCPWCSLVCKHLYSLLKHVSLCHPRFLFTYTPMEGGSIIDVHLNKLYEAGQTSMDRDPVERSGMSLRQRWKGPLKCLPCTAIIVERHEGLEEDLSEFLNDGSWKRGYNVKRQYYHSHTCLPMVPEEIDADSEAEQESISRWQKICSQKMIDEFTDVNKGEKELMKMWNLFAMDQGMTAYKQIPNACVKFTREKSMEILQKKIVNSFMAHLISLCDFGLITPSVIKHCMDIIHTMQSLS